MPSQRKIDIVEKLKEKAARAKSIVFTNYQGLAHKQLEGLKCALKDFDAELMVTKNTLLQKSLSTLNSSFDPELRTEGQLSTMEGPTATLFIYGDSIVPLRELAKSIRLLKLPTIKLAMLDGKMVDAEVALRLATLPSREVLIAQLIGQLKSPLFGLNKALNWNLQKLVLTLKIGGEKYGRK